MRRRTLVWAAVTVVALLLTPPVMAAYEVLEEGNLVRVEGLRTDTSVAYDLVVAPSGQEPYTIRDYLTAETGTSDTHAILGHDFDDSILLTYRARQAAVAQSADGSFLDDLTQESLVSAQDGTILASRTTGGYWTWVNDREWQHTRTQEERFGESHGTWLHPPSESFYLYDARLNTTLALKMLDRIEKDLPVRHADAAGMVDGRRVLGVSVGDSSSTPVARDAPCPLSSGVDLDPWRDWEGPTVQGTMVRWYESGSGWPLRIECQGEYVDEDGKVQGHVLAYLQRTTLDESGVPMKIAQPQEAPVEDLERRPLDLYPPEQGELPYTMADAHRALSQDDSLQHFHDFIQDGPIALRWAHLRYSDGPRDGTGVQYTVRDLLGTASSDAPVYATWNFAYVNGDGDALHVASSKWLGTPLPPDNWEDDVEAGTADHIAVALQDGLQADLLAVETSFALAERAGRTFSHQPDTAFEYRLGVMIKNDEPVTQHHYLLAHGSGNDREEVRWDAETGAVAGALTMSADYGGEPPEPRPETLSATTPTSARSSAMMATGLAVTGGAAVLVLGLLHSKAVLGLLYAKIARSKVLDHPRREELYEFVRINPGTSLRDAQQALGLGWGSAIHHLATLERNGFLASRRSGRHRRFWVSAEKPLDEIRREALLAEPTPRRIVEMLTLEPNLSQAELARRLGLARSTVHHHVTRLTAAGLVPKTRGKEGDEGGAPPAAAPLPPATVK